MVFALAAGAGVLALILASVWSLNRRRMPEPVRLHATPVVERAAVAADVLGDSEFLQRAEPLAKAFLEAASVEDILPLVRDPETAGPRIRAAHPDGSIMPLGLAKFNVQQSVIHSDGLYQVTVETSDYEMRPMTFVRSGEGLLVDWEAWVGWSEMGWREFLDGKPEDPKVFRVLVRQADYYNFGFSDEDTWRSYQLESPDRDHSIYGYAERGGIADGMLRAYPDLKESSFVVEIRFPAGIESRNQVVIERVIAEGWAIGTPGKP